MSRYNDFDAVFAERAQAVEPIVFRLGGEEYTLPGNLPAEVGLITLSLGNPGDTNTRVGLDGMGRLLGSILGKEQYARFLGTGIDSDQLLEIFQWVFAQYEDGVLKEASGNAQAPATGRKRRSSKTGA